MSTGGPPLSDLPVVGIDVSTKHIAMSCPRTAWARKVTRTMLHKHRKPLVEAAELAGLAHNALAGQFGRFTGFSVFIEAPVLAGMRNVQTTIRLALVTGALGQALGGDATMVPVSSWKKEVVGHGHATKADVAQWLTINCPEMADLCEADQDLIDATCVALYGQSYSAMDADTDSELGFEDVIVPRKFRRYTETGDGWKTVG